MKILARNTIPVIISDLQMPEMNKMGLLQRIKQDYPNVSVIVVATHGSINAAVEAIKRGASDFLAKPFEASQLQMWVEYFL